MASNTIEGRVLQRLLEKLQEIRDALDDDAVFNVVGEILPAAHVDRVLREYYSGRLGDADLEDRLLRNVDEGQFRAICQNALEGLATKKLNLEMLVERRALAKERRMVPETIARLLREASDYVPMTLKPVPGLLHAFEPARTPPVLRRYEAAPDWKLPALANRYPRCSTDRETADEHNLEWVTPGHRLFEAIRRHTLAEARGAFAAGATYYSLQHEEPARIDFYRARIVDGLGNVIDERLFAVELGDGAEPELRDPGVLANFTSAEPSSVLGAVGALPDASSWLHEQALAPFLADTRGERLAELDRVAKHVELSLTELLQRADEEIGRAADEVERRIVGAEGRLAQAEARHAELLNRRERRRAELEQQRALTLQAVECLASVVVLPHPDGQSPEVRRMRPNPETEATAMRVVMEYEEAQGRKVYDVHEKNLGYDVTSLDVASGELRLIEVKGLAAQTGTVLLTPNERRVAEDRRDCFWLYVVTGCAETPQLMEPIADPTRFAWNEVSKIAHYYMKVGDMTQPMSKSEGGSASETVS